MRRVQTKLPRNKNDDEFPHQFDENTEIQPNSPIINYSKQTVNDPKSQKGAFVIDEALENLIITVTSKSSDADSPYKMSLKDRYNYAKEKQTERENERLHMIKRNSRKSLDQPTTNDQTALAFTSPNQKDFNDKFRTKVSSPNQLWSVALRDLQKKQESRFDLEKSKSNEFSSTVNKYHVAKERIHEWEEISYYEPTARELADTWQKVRGYLQLSPEKQTGYIQDASETQLLLLGSIKVLSNELLNEEGHQFLKRVLVAPTKYVGLRSSVTSFKNTRPPIKVIAMACRMKDKEYRIFSMAHCTYETSNMEYPATIAAQLYTSHKLTLCAPNSKTKFLQHTMHLMSSENLEQFRDVMIEDIKEIPDDLVSNESQSVSLSTNDSNPAVDMVTSAQSSVQNCDSVIDMLVDIVAEEEEEGMETTNETTAEEEMNSVEIVAAQVTNEKLVETPSIDKFYNATAIETETTTEANPMETSVVSVQQVADDDIVTKEMEEVIPEIIGDSKPTESSLIGEVEISIDSFPSVSKLYSHEQSVVDVIVDDDKEVDREVDVSCIGREEELFQFLNDTSQIVMTKETSILGLSLSEEVEVGLASPLIPTVVRDIIVDSDIACRVTNVDHVAQEEVEDGNKDREEEEEEEEAEKVDDLDTVMLPMSLARPSSSASSSSTSMREEKEKDKDKEKYSDHNSSLRSFSSYRLSFRDSFDSENDHLDHPVDANYLETSSLFIDVNLDPNAETHQPLPPVQTATVYYPAALSSPPSQAFLKLNINSIDEICCSDRVFAAVSHQHHRNQTVFVSHSLKQTVSLESQCVVVKNRIFELSRGVAVSG
jgi:hypothetical protein